MGGFKRVAIVGCGYVGSALGRTLVEAGHDVVGTTTEPSRVNQIEAVGIRPHVLTLAHIDPSRDVHRSGNPVLDASLRQQPNWHPRRIGIDATSKGPKDGFERPWPTEQKHPVELLDAIEADWTSMGLPGRCPR